MNKCFTATVTGLLLALIVLPAEPQATTSPPAGEAQEKREERDTVPITILISGPKIDDHLTAVYAYLARSQPKLLSPVPIDFSTYGTVSESALGSGVLFRYYPEEFTSEVHVPLSNWAKYKAQPGLKPVLYDYPATVRQEEAQKVKGDICQIFRIDGKDCAAKSSGNYMYLRGQGVRITLEVPRQESKNFVKGIRDALKAHPGYEKDVKVFAARSMKKQNSPTGDVSPIQFKSIKNADGSEIDGTNVYERIKAYYAAIHYYVPSQANNPVQVLILDSFPRDAGEILYQPKHPNFRDSAPKYVPTLTAKSSEEGHGLHVAGLVGAQPNGYGIAGVAPKAKLLLLSPKGKVANTDDFRATVVWAYENEEYNIKIFHASLAADDVFDKDLKSTFREWFKNTHLDRLYVFAAGNSKKQLTEQDCGVFPACLGDVPNVIVVAALGEEPLARPQLWTKSNFGVPMVSLAAPGVGILSTDLEDRYSIQDGTSSAAPFVTGAAALLWQVKPNLEAYEVKQRLIATSRFDLAVDQSEHLVGGVLDIEAAVTNVSEDVVILDNQDKPIVGTIEAKLFRGDLLLYKREMYLPGEKADYKCNAENLLRIYRRGERFTVVCKSEFKPFGKKVGVAVWHNKILNPIGGGMACITEKNCLTISYRNADGHDVRKDIDLFSIRDIYFGIGK